MTPRSGPAAASRGQKPQPSNPQPGPSAAGPDQGVAFVAYGLRPRADGYELVKVAISGDETTITVLRQAEPQRAVAFRYLEAAVEDAYMESRG